MDRIFTILERFAPESIEIIENRYKILRQVLHNQPLGRRQISKNLGFSEREVRNEVELLKNRGALESTQAGIYITAYGEELLREVDEIVPWIFKIQSLADKLKERFRLKQVIIVPGDSYVNEAVKEDMGRAAAEHLRRIMFPACTLAVTGGTTLAKMSEYIRPGINATDICVVPARGGLGENVEQQAGNIAAHIARTIGAQYRLLHIPDNIEESTARALQKDIHIQEVIKIIKSADILVHGIGPAAIMAEKRGLAEQEIEYLQQMEARGEAMRYYFDRWGKIIFEIPGLGLDQDDLDSIKTIMAVAGGSNKAAAIEAVLKHGQQKVLVTDEGAAQKIINGKDAC